MTQTHTDLCTETRDLSCSPDAKGKDGGTPRCVRLHPPGGIKDGQPVNAQTSAHASLRRAEGPRPAACGSAAGPVQRGEDPVDLKKTFKGACLTLRPPGTRWHRRSRGAPPCIPTDTHCCFPGAELEMPRGWFLSSYRSQTLAFAIRHVLNANEI